MVIYLLLEKIVESNLGDPKISHKIILSQRGRWVIDDDQLKDYQEDIELYIDTPTVSFSSDFISQSYRNISEHIR